MPAERAPGRSPTPPRPAAVLLTVLAVAAIIPLAGCGDGADEPASLVTMGSTSADARQMEASVAAEVTSVAPTDNGPASGDIGAATSDTAASPSPAPSGKHEPAVGDRRQVAQAVGARIEIFSDPAAGAPTWTLDNPNPRGGPLTFLVERRQADWLYVDVPVRPNGSSGWVRDRDVLVGWTDFSLHLDLTEHTLTVRGAGRPDRTIPVAVGSAATPTPTGEFYLAELVKLPTPGGPYGPFAFGLSAFSEVLGQFNGGDPIIALHGTNQPDRIGSNVSNGCVRMSNDNIMSLASTVPLGTPITIVA